MRSKLKVRSTKLLLHSSGAELHFYDPLKVILEEQQKDGRFICTIPEFCNMIDPGGFWSYRACGHSPEEAIDRLVERIREETDRLRRTPSHRIRHPERAWKGVLLGAIDIASSELMGEVPKHTWVFGRLVRLKKGALRFRTVGSDRMSFSLTPELEKTTTYRKENRFARVKTGKAGQAVGPVDLLEDPLSPMSPEEIWQKWQSIAERGKDE